MTVVPVRAASLSASSCRAAKVNSLHAPPPAASPQGRLITGLVQDRGDRLIPVCRDGRRDLIADELVVADAHDLDSTARLITPEWQHVAISECGPDPSRGLAPYRPLRPERRQLYAPARLRRGPITGVRAALSGYQDGRCAYCHTEFTDIGTSRVAVDHVLPWVLMTRQWQDGDLHQVWNLVLAC
jgi:hypothetical protein